MADQFTGHSPLFSNDRVYTNEEYTLLVDRSVASETYRRLHHRDIQSLQLVIEPIRKVRLILCSVGFFSFLLFGLLAWFDSSVGWAVLLLIITGVFGFVALYEVLTAGKRCRVFATTAVQKASLPGLTKVTNAQRYMDTVTPLITEAQGTLSADDLQAGLDSDRKERQHKRSGMQPSRPANRDEPPPIPKSEIAPANDDEPAPESPSGTIEGVPHNPEIEIAAAGDSEPAVQPSSNVAEEPAAMPQGEMNDTHQ